jgi:hypothetical protein
MITAGPKSQKARLGVLHWLTVGALEISKS